MKAGVKLSDILALECTAATGHPNHWDVASSKDAGQTYRVRLQTTHGAVACECGDWTFTASTRLERGEEPFTSRTMCIHIARALFADAQQRLAPRRAA